MGVSAPFRRDDDSRPPLDWADYRSTELRAPRRSLRPLGQGEVELSEGPRETAFFAL